VISLATRAIDEVEAGLCREWQGIRDARALAETLAAEQMRGLIYGAAAVPRGFEASRTVHTARLHASARRAVELLWPRFSGDRPASDLCSATLERMGEIGDAVRTTSGEWLASPLRIVGPPADSMRYLVVGAAPAQAVHQRLGIQPVCAGVSRFVGAGVLEARGNDDLIVSVDDWLGHQEPLEIWTARLLASHEPRMEVVGGLAADHLELYAPDISRAQRRTGRWVPAQHIGKPLEGPRLCRPQDRYARSWDRPYYVAHFEFTHGALALRRAASVSRDLTLRLAFGFDIMLGTPRRVSIMRHAQAFSIDRPLTLPQPESRAYALGWTSPSPGHEERLAFHPDAMPFVERSLQRLSVASVFTVGGTA
jgi:hypothetical protein